MKTITRYLTLGASILLGVALSACSDNNDYAGKYRDSIYTEYTLYNVDDQQLPELDEEVTPVYQMMIIRHGSRYLDGHRSYASMLALFTEAEEGGWLTDEGREFLTWYRGFYPLVEGQEDKLTDVGRKQHADIAESQFQWVPSLYQGACSLRVCTSPSQRVIDSQSAFLGRLSELNSNISYTTDTLELLHVHNTWDLPEICSADYDAYVARQVDIQEFLHRYFTETHFVAKYFWGDYNFIRVMRNLLAGLSSLDFEAPDGYQRFFSKEDYRMVHNIQSTYTYLLLGRSQQSDSFGIHWYEGTWNYMASNTIKDLEEGKIHAGLYFSHDILLDNLLAYMQAGSFGDSFETLDEVAEQFPLSAVPMAANFQVLICDDHTNDTRIAYPLLNGRPIPLKGLEEVRKGAYRWDEVCQRMMGM